MPNALGLLGEARMQATPRNKLMGLLADALTAANDYAQKPDARMPGGKANPVLGLLADGVSLNSLATTAQRASYGEPLTNKGKANVPFMKPETADALMMAPLSPRNALAMMGAGMADNGAMAASGPLRRMMYHGGTFHPKPTADKQGVIINGLPGVSLTPSKAAARNYAQHNVGNVYGIDTASAKIYKPGTDKALDAAMAKNNWQAIAGAGFDGVEIVPGKETVLFDYPAAAKSAQLLEEFDGMAGKWKAPR